MDTKEFNELLRGKTEEQKKIIKYFVGSAGCLDSFTGMKVDEYEQMVISKLNSLNLKQRALGKIGLDEDQLKEIPPVYLHGYNFDKGAYARVGSDDRLRSTKYDAAWLFFSDTQVYMYSYTLDMISDSKKEKTEEYFYKDVTNFSTSTETLETIKTSASCFKLGETTKITRDYGQFSLVVPGEKFTCSVSGVADIESSVSAMRQKLREKKQK